MALDIDGKPFERAEELLRIKSGSRENLKKASTGFANSYCGIKPTQFYFDDNGRYTAGVAPKEKTQ